MKKPNFYDLLELSPNASIVDIRDAFFRLSKKYRAEVPGLTKEDCDNKLKVIQQAFQVLSNETSRGQYDARMRGDNASYVIPPTLRAEPAAATASWKPLKVLLTVIASLMAIGLVMQLSYMFVAYRQVKIATGNDAEYNEVTDKAREKVILQEFYQETGIRAASIAEMELLKKNEQQNSNNDYQNDYEKRAKELEYERFVEESRRVGQEVTANNVAERERAQREQEQQKRQEEQAELERKQQESQRVEMEMNKYRSVLSRGTNQYGGSYQNNEPSQPSTSDAEE